MIQLLKRSLAWILHSFGVLTLIELVLLSLTLIGVARGLAAVVEHLPNGLMLSGVVLGVIVGWLLGRTRLSGWKSAAGLLAAGLIVLALTIGRTGGPLLAFVASFWRSLRQLFACPLHPGPGATGPCGTPFFTPTVQAAQALTVSLTALLARIFTWVAGVFSGAIVIDPLVSGLFWSLALWLTVTWASWWARRRRAIPVALLPALALLAYNVYYTNNLAGIVWLVLAAGGTVLLQALDSYWKSDQRWNSQQIGRVGIELNLAGVTALLAIGLMLAGGLLPGISLGKIRHDLQDLFQTDQNGNVGQSLAYKKTPEVAQVGSTTSGGIGLAVAHTVGAGPHLSQKPVMYVTVEGYQPPPPPEVLRLTNAQPPAVRYYWRAQTYDLYNGHTWIDDTSQTQDVPAGTPYYPQLDGDPANYQEVRIQVERLQHMNGALFAAGQLLSAGQPSIAAWRAPSDLIDAETDPDTYSAVSRIPYVSVEQLRAAGNDFPDAIRSRYLNLPEEVPQRVRELALDLTAHELNLYDRAITIEAYLRQFPYSLDVPAPPVNREVADYFLFDLKKGYCDYYATTMVVLARAAGLPSRLVIGYTSGSYDYDNRRFVVAAADAHAWVEIYFPGIGWVEFEPTSNETTIPRPGKAEAANLPAIATPIAGEPGSSGAQPGFHIRLPDLSRPLGLLGMLLIVLLVLVPLEGWLLYLRPPDQAIEAIFRRLYRQGRRWGLPETAARTPHEFAAALSDSLKELKQDQRRAGSIAAVRQDLDWLTGLYTRQLFSPRPATVEEHHQAVRTWMRLQWRLLWFQPRKIKPVPAQAG